MMSHKLSAHGLDLVYLLAVEENSGLFVVGREILRTYKHKTTQNNYQQNGVFLLFSVDFCSQNIDVYICLYT